MSNRAQETKQDVIDEICNLFKSWAGKTVYSINEEMLLDLIQHFYPDVAIDDDKYIVVYFADDRHDNSTEFVIRRCNNMEEYNDAILAIS